MNDNFSQMLNLEYMGAELPQSVLGNTNMLKVLMNFKKDLLKDKREEAFLKNHKLSIRVLSFLENREIMVLQLLNKRYYRFIIPKMLRKAESFLADERRKLTLRDKKKLLTKGKISHMAAIGNRHLLVCSDSFTSEIYCHTQDVRSLSSTLLRLVTTLQKS